MEKYPHVSHVFPASRRRRRLRSTAPICMVKGVCGQARLPQECHIIIMCGSSDTTSQWYQNIYSRSESERTRYISNTIQILPQRLHAFALQRRESTPDTCFSKARPNKHYGPSIKYVLAGGGGVEWSRYSTMCYVPNTLQNIERRQETYYSGFERGMGNAA